MQPERVQVHTEFEDSHWWFVGRRRILNRLVRELLPPHQNHAIVDIGCGTGANIASLDSAYVCFGIDPSPDAIASARSRFPHVSFECGLAPGALATLGATPELVLLTDVIEHVGDDRGFLRGILQALRPGTLVLITVPAEPSLWTIHDVAFGHYRRYVPGSLRELWRGQLVTEILLSSFNHYLYPAVRVLRALNRVRGTSSGAADTDFSMPPQPINRLLTAIFAAEAGTLTRAIKQPGAPRFSSGVSLVAVLRYDGAASPADGPR